jgi:hypothetical protein
MGNTPTLQDAAKEILRIAVREQKTKADQPIDSGPVIAGFNNLPWKPADLRPALVFAQEQGWVTVEGHLTAAGLAAAPPF